MLMQQNLIWGQIWKLDVHERVRCFIWIVCHGRLITNKLKHLMNLSVLYCYRCTLQVESIMHVLRECPLAMVVWIHTVPMVLRSSFCTVNLQQWIESSKFHMLELQHFLLQEEIYCI